MEQDQFCLELLINKSKKSYKKSPQLNNKLMVLQKNVNQLLTDAHKNNNIQSNFDLFSDLILAKIKSVIIDFDKKTD